MTLFDISLTISEDLPVWPGDPIIELKKISQIKDGELANVTHLSACVHIGTHVDAPDHFLGNGQTVEGLPLDLMIGEAAVVEIPVEGRDLTASELDSASIPEGTKRLLIKTSNSRLWAEAVKDFKEDFIALEADAATYLVERGVELVGVDYLSVAPYANPDPTHKILLEAGVLIIEGLNLAVKTGEYTLYCLPIKISGSDGAPARVLLGRD